MRQDKLVEVKNSTKKEVYSFILDFKERYFKLKNTFCEEIIKKSSFSKEELYQAREACIRG